MGARLRRVFGEIHLATVGVLGHPCDRRAVGSAVGASRSGSSRMARSIAMHGSFFTESIHAKVRLPAGLIDALAF
jgi:hypothetical protein